MSDYTNPQNLDITFRKITKDDIPYVMMIEKLADISNIISGKSVVSIEKIINNNYEESKKYFLDKILESDGYVIIHDNSIIGCGFLIDKSEFYEIQSVYVEPSFQRQGVGSKLIQFFIEKAKVENKNKLELETGTAEEFYKKQGFESVKGSFKMILYIH